MAPADAPARCLDCWNASSLAAQCSQDSQCTGFSNLHGLLREPFPRLGDRKHLLPAPATAATSGLAAGQDPRPWRQRRSTGYCAVTAHTARQRLSTTAVTLRSDSLCCGRSCCPAASQHRTHSQLTLTLPVLPRVWSSTITCAQGAVLLRGVPRPLFVMFTHMQRLSISVCGMALRGTLPQQFSTMRLDHLNLSSNALTGGIPSSWFRVMQPSANANATSTPQPIAGAAYAADLSSNSLVGPLQRSFVEGACRWGDAYLEFDGLSAAAPAGAGMPGWVLWGNGDLQSWVLPYAYAVRRSRYSAEEGQTNMCGSYQ